MNGVPKICCSGSDIDAVAPSRRPNILVPEKTPGQLLQHLRSYGLTGKKHGNGYLVSEAHFLPHGKLHDIVISFDGEERTKMIVAIDNKIVSELDIKDKLLGSTELHLNDPQYFSDEIVIDFKWKLYPGQKHFGFYTKTLSHKMATGSSSYNNGNNDEHNYIEEEFQGEWYACRLQVRPVE